MDWKKGVSILLSALLVGSSMTGCARLLDTNEVEMSGTNQPYSYITGVVTFARPAVIKDENEMGTWLGGAIGYILGSLFGRGKGNTLATVGGTLGGALIGHEIDKGNGQEIGVRLADGSEIVIVVKTNEVFQPGDMIRIIKSGDRIIRVEHM